MRYALAAAALVGAGVMGNGCVVREEHPRRHVVYDAPPPPPPAPVVTYYDPPPPPLVEVVPAAPGPDYVWVGGGYHRDHDRWAWHRGYYDHRRHY